MQPKKQLKVQYTGIFEFLLTKNAQLEKGPKNLGIGRLSPLIRAMPERKRFFVLMSSLTAKTFFADSLSFILCL